MSLKIVVITREGCKPCKEVCKVLDGEDVEYTKLDADSSEAGEYEYHFPGKFRYYPKVGLFNGERLLSCFSGNSKLTLRSMIAEYKNKNENYVKE